MRWVKSFFKPGNSEAMLQRLLVLLVLFLIVSIWTDPEGMSRQVGAFLGDVGQFAFQVLHTGADFLRFLTAQ